MKHLTFLLFFLPTIASAQDFFATVETNSEDEAVSLDSPWQTKSWLQQKIGYGWHTPALPANRDGADLTRVETQAFGEVSWRSGPWRWQASGSLVQDWLPDLERAGVWSGYEFSDEQIKERRWRLELADTFVSWQEGDWWLKAGYQTLAWGEAESLKVTDVLARRDQRWPGQDDLENLRLPVGAISVTWANQLDFVTLIEPLPDRLPAAFEEFDPYIGVRQLNDQTLNVIEQRDSDPGFALRWRNQWQGVDAQIMVADVASYELAPVRIDSNGLTLAPWRNQVLGLAIQAVQSNFLLRAEQAWHHKVKVAETNPLAPWRDTDQWRGMLGADFTGIDDLVLTGELSWVMIDNWQPDLSVKRWQPGASARASYTLFNERLTLEAFAQAVSGGEGSVTRVSAEWTFSDSLSATVSAIDYGASDSTDTLYPYRRNDALLVSMRWALP